MTASLALIRIGSLLLVGSVLCLSLSCGSDSSTDPRLPADIVITPNHPQVDQGLTLQLTATVVDADGRAINSQHANFTSADTTVATVTPAGLVTSRGPLGVARMTAATGSVTGYVDVAIRRRIVGMQVTPDSLVLNPTFSAQLQVSLVDYVGDAVNSPGTVSFTSSNPQLVMVSPTGLVSTLGLATGNATVTVLADTFSTQVPVTVVQIAASVTMTPQTVVLNPGGSRQLIPLVLDLASRAIPGVTPSYVSTTPSVFTVSTNGLVTAGGTPGTGAVVATVDTVSDTVAVFVGTAPPGTIVQTTLTGGAAYAAAVTASGAIVISLPGSGTVMLSSVQTLLFDDTVAVNGDPLGVAVDPSGTRAFVALRGTGRLGVIDLASAQVYYPPFTVPSGDALSVIVSHDGQFLFVGSRDLVYKLDAGTFAVLDSVDAGYALHLALHPVQDLLYSSMQAVGRVEEIDIATMDTIRSFGPFNQLQAVAVAQDGSTLFAADESSDRVARYDLATGQALTDFTRGSAFGLVIQGQDLCVTGGGLVTCLGAGSGTAKYSTVVGGTSRRPAMSGDGVLIVPNESGWVDFLQ